MIWLRGGTSPEVWSTTFEISTDGSSWSCLGAGERINGGWRLGNVSLPANGYVRARGFTAGGQYNASSWFVETSFGPPRILSSGMRTNAFTLTGYAPGQNAVVESSTNLLNWLPLKTNPPSPEPWIFPDPSASNTPAKFCRLRVQ